MSIYDDLRHKFESEYCGHPGELRYELPWMKTLCDECLPAERDRHTPERLAKYALMADDRKAWYSKNFS